MEDNIVTIQKNHKVLGKVPYYQLSAFCREHVSLPLNEPYTFVEPYFDAFMKSSPYSLLLPSTIGSTELILKGNQYCHKTKPLFPVASDAALEYRKNPCEIKNGIISSDGETLSLKMTDRHENLCKLYLHYLFMKSHKMYLYYLKYLKYYIKYTGLPLAEDFAIKFLDFIVFSCDAGFYITTTEAKKEAQQKQCYLLQEYAKLTALPISLDKSEKNLRIKVLTELHEMKIKNSSRK